MMLKPGREVLDPLNRVVTVVRVLPDDMVEVRLAGPYGATVRYPRSTLSPVESPPNPNPRGITR